MLDTPDTANAAEAAEFNNSIISGLMEENSALREQIKGLTERINKITPRGRPSDAEVADAVIGTMCGGKASMVRFGTLLAYILCIMRENKLEIGDPLVAYKLLMGCVISDDHIRFEWGAAKKSTVYVHANTFVVNAAKALRMYLSGDSWKISFGYYYALASNYSS